MFYHIIKREPNHTYYYKAGGWTEDKYKARTFTKESAERKLSELNEPAAKIEKVVRTYHGEW